jgi:hypothetical protein
LSANLSSWLLLPTHRRYAISWTQGQPRAGEYDTMFENCRRQAGDGMADGWCGCYVKQYSVAKPGTRASPVDVMANAKTTAFVGDYRVWVSGRRRPSTRGLTGAPARLGPVTTVDVRATSRAPRPAMRRTQACRRG